MTPSLGALQADADRTLDEMKRERVLSRIWAGDYTLWKPSPAEISNRLGWLRIADHMRAALPEMDAFVREVRGAGYSHALLLGMGGSSLAPDVFRRTFGVAPGHLDLSVLDSTDPQTVLAQRQRLDPARTLFLVSTKSGGTVETFSFFRYFHQWLVETLGRERAGEHFVAITDPGSALADTARQYGFRKTFINDPDIGGRYSALSHFGLVPAALIGANVALLIDRAIAAAGPALRGGPADDAGDPSAQLGAALGAAAQRGHDKVTFILSPAIAAFGSWAEQLIAESTGKEGHGILPVDGEPVGAPDVYGADRLFAYLRLAGDATHDAAVARLAAAGQPVVRIELADPYDLGREIFRWEMATAIAGWRLGINPFDQPNVESAKVLARQMVKSYEESGALPPLEPTLRTDGIAAVSDLSAPTLEALVQRFLAQARPGDYVAVQAYVPPTERTTAALQALRTRVRDRLRVATTVGYGPRFLHSTGQLHKGDGANGLFIQVVATGGPDVPIPDAADAPASRMSFGVLIRAQALGDRAALLAGKRRVLRVELANVEEGLGRLIGCVA